MKLMVIGINHATANVELRERFAIAPELQMQAIESLKANREATGGVGEALILSTCNRTEIIVGEAGSELPVLEWLSNYCDIEPQQFAGHVYTHRGEHALAHLIKVGCGMDSMVFGEPQILGQMKSAYSVAKKVTALGSELEPVFQHVFAVVKRVRTGTAIGENPVSVAYAAVTMAERIFSDITSVSVLLIGAGEMIELVAKHVKEAGARHIAIANRTIDKASDLANQLGGVALLLSDLPEQLAHFDAVISSTGSQLPILGKGMVEQALKQRRRKPMFFVDIAVPRDIEPQVAELTDAYLYSIDDLKDIIDHNLKLRAGEADKASEIISAGVKEYQQRLHSRAASDLVVEYRANSEAICNEELRKARQLLDSGQSAEVVLETFARSLTRKLIHKTSVELRNAAAQQDQGMLDSARLLLGINSGARKDGNDQ